MAPSSQKANSERIPSPLRAIRYHCIDCFGGSKAEVKDCTSYDCQLYPYRMGRNPNRKGAGGNPNLKGKVK